MTAAVSLSDFDIKYQHEGEVATVYITSPATMDSGDTVDITTLLNGRKLVNLSAWDIDTTNGVNAVTATYNVSTDVILVDTGGATTNSTYVLNIDLLSTNSSK